MQKESLRYPSLFRGLYRDFFRTSSATTFVNVPQKVLFLSRAPPFEYTVTKVTRIRGLFSVAVMNNASNTRNSRRIRHHFRTIEYYSLKYKIEIWIMQIQTGSVLCKYSQDVCYANSYYANVLAAEHLFPLSCGGAGERGGGRARESILREFTHYTCNIARDDYLPRVTTN